MIKIIYWIKLSSILALLFIATSCKPKIGAMGNKNNSAQSNNNFYTSFYVNDTTTTNYIKPLKYINSASKLLLDITYQEINDKIENTKINFSIISKEKIKNSAIQSVFINSIEVIHYKILYNDYDGKKYDLRFSVNGNYDFLKSFDSNSRIKVIANDEDFVYIPSSKSKKKLNNIVKLID